ncbi:MAG: nitroreductase family protein [Chloroflexota bacterium]
MSEQKHTIIEEIILKRKTEKVLIDPSSPISIANPAEFNAQVAEMIAIAGHAPFHREASSIHRETLVSAVPWRFYVLGNDMCRELLSQLKSKGDSYMRGKIPMMLAAAGALIQVTWLPDDDDLSSLKNQEHLMAASAATQNLLLAATARGISNYWSSGGILRQPELYEMLGMPPGELLVGSIFLFPQVTSEMRVGTGSNRGKNNPVEEWAHWVSL